MHRSTTAASASGTAGIIAPTRSGSSTGSIRTGIAPLEEQLNPDVTVRQNGIMEKCTFCVQRIRQGKEQAEREGRRVRDGDITPACVQSCPTSALVFGDRHDPNSRVAKMAVSERGFHLLESLGTHPAITYLKRLD